MAIVRFKRTAPHLRVKNFGPIKNADVVFRDLTVLVGPQATGKSVFLQLLKLMIDVKHIRYEFKRAGIDWQKKLPPFLDVYFGEGMQNAWKKSSHIEWQNAEVSLSAFVNEGKPTKGGSMFFVPAQRVLTLREGWPQAFVYYDPGVPFAVREFSEELRLLMTELTPSETLFPVPRRLKQEFRELLQKHVFGTFRLKIDSQRAQKRLVLSDDGDGSSLPFMVWSAGQREFVPLMLGLYHLLTPAGASTRAGIKWVVIEELEMGLHPRAISVIMLMIFELVQRGYKVCISTHSTQVLDAVWAFQRLKAANASAEALLHVFDAPAGLWDVADGVLKKTAKVYYFDREEGTKDISNLDSWSEDEAESGWGGLTELSGRANEIVAQTVANSRA